MILPDEGLKGFLLTWLILFGTESADFDDRAPIRAIYGTPIPLGRCVNYAWLAKRSDTFWITEQGIAYTTQLTEDNHVTDS